MRDFLSPGNVSSLFQAYGKVFPLKIHPLFFNSTSITFLIKKDFASPKIINIIF